MEDETLLETPEESSSEEEVEVIEETEEETETLEEVIEIEGIPYQENNSYAFLLVLLVLFFGCASIMSRSFARLKGVC